MTIQSFSRRDYIGSFLGEEKIARSALERALDIRKFEIDLYWKRAAYFWTFIGATFVGFTAIQVGKIDDGVVRRDLLVLLANVGIVFSVAWLCINKGSKYWQENWERHVDMLEDKIQGPLYKVIMREPQPTTRIEVIKGWLTGPAAISVSRVNQVVSWFVVFVWIMLLWNSLQTIDLSAKVCWKYVAMCFGTLAACASLAIFCRSAKGERTWWASQRVVD